MLDTVLLVAALPGALVVLATGASYGKLVAGRHWGPGQLPLALACLLLGAGAGILVVERLLGGDPRPVPALLVGALCLVAGLTALAGARPYAAWVSLRDPQARTPLHRWPAAVRHVVLPACVVVTGVVLLVDALG
jgi:hypothetical protein